MKVVILCGGMGTRIRDANENLPKPLLPIGGKPIVWHIMKGYAQQGFSDFILCLGYKGWLLKGTGPGWSALSSETLANLRPMLEIAYERSHWNVDADGAWADPSNWISGHRCSVTWGGKSRSPRAMGCG